MDIRQCFEILEIDTDATIADVNAAYKDLVAVWHPDRFTGNPRLKEKAEEKLKTINRAHEKILFLLNSKQSPPRTPKNPLSPFDLTGNTQATGAPFAKASMRSTEIFSEVNTGSRLNLQPAYRFFARILDYSLFMTLLKLCRVDEIIPTNEFNLFIMPVLITFAWIIPEAVSLSWFGFTPGKWLLGISIRDKFRLKPGFTVALGRSLSVWCNGMGMGVLFIAPFTASIGRHKLKFKGVTQWDLDGKFSINHTKPGRMRMSVACLAGLLSVLLLFVNPEDILIKTRNLLTTIHPDNFNSRLRLGDSYAQMGDYNKAIAVYKEAIDIEPDHAQLYLNLGLSYVALHKYQDAIGAFNSVVKHDPVHFQAHYQLGICYSDLNLPEKAISSFKKCIETKLDYPPAYVHLGLSYLALGRYNSAITALNKAIDLKSDDAEAYYSLGVCFAKLRQPEQAVANLKMAIHLASNHARAYHVLGLTYLSQGQKDWAIQQYEQLRNLDKELADELLEYIEKYPQ